MNTIYNKEQTCQGCPDRSINCHATCPEYLQRRKLRNEMNQERRKTSQSDCVFCENMAKIKALIAAKRKRGRHHYN